MYGNDLFFAAELAKQNIKRKKINIKKTHTPLSQFKNGDKSAMSESGMNVHNYIIGWQYIMENFGNVWSENE